MNLILERYCYGHVLPFRLPTMGRLTVGSDTFHTLEDPWNNNKPFDSCVPDGLYDLVPHDSPKHPDTWALVNPDLGIHHFPANSGRFAILIHPGNYETDVEGCIAPGKSAALVDNRHMVTNSKTAMEAIRRLLGVGTKHTLLIRGVHANTFE